LDEFLKERCPKEFPVKVRVSYQRLMKQWVWNRLHKKPNKSRTKKKLVKEFLKTKYFQRTEMDWLEAGL
jgi:pre-mRNA-processing factor 8